MTKHDSVLASRFIAGITELVGNQGLTLEVGSDFHCLEKILKEQPLRNPLAPKFDPRRNDLDASTAFWIVGRDPQGEMVHTQAMRLIDLEGSSLASFLEERFCEFMPAGFEIRAEDSRYRSAPGSRSLTGKLCYHGELWLKGGPGGYRGAGMTAVLARMAMAMSFLRWAPDYVFGFMFPLAACKGLAAREGYMHTEPGSIFWALAGEDQDLEEWTVWMSRDDIRHILEIPPQHLFEQLEAAQRRQPRDRAA